MVLLWTHHSAVPSGSGTFNSFSLRPDIHVLRSQVCQLHIQVTKELSLGWERQLGALPVCLSNHAYLYTVLFAFAPPTSYLVAFHLKWQPVSISCIQTTSRHGDSSFLYVLLPVWPLDKFYNKSLVITGHRNSCLLESQSYVTE